MGAQKIKGSKLEIFGMVIALFLVDDKDRKFCFFKESFSLADINMDIDFRMFFFILSKVKVISTIASLSKDYILLEKLYLPLKGLN